MPTRYKIFDELSKLMEVTKTDRGYSKFIQTGDLSLYDYGRGFIDLEIYYFYDKIKNQHFVRLWFGTIDDGDFGSWTEVDSETSALKLIDQLVNEVFKDMVSFPTDIELNKILQQYRVYVHYE